MRRGVKNLRGVTRHLMVSSIGGDKFRRLSQLLYNHVRVVANASNRIASRRLLCGYSASNDTMNASLDDSPFLKLICNSGDHELLLA